MIVRWFLFFEFRLLYWEVHFNPENQTEHDFLCPTHGYGRWHGRRRVSTDVCLHRLSTSILGQTPHQPGVQLLPSALRSSARLPRSVTCLSRSLRRTMRATRATPYVAKTSRACVPRSVIRAQDWTHTCLRCARWRGTFHDARACFSNVHSPLHNPCHNRYKTYSTRTSDGAPRAGSHKRQGRLARSAMSCSFQFAARSTRRHVIWRFRPRYRSAPTRTSQGLTSATRRAHKCHMLHVRTGTNALSATCGWAHWRTVLEYALFFREFFHFGNVSPISLVPEI